MCVYESEQVYERGIGIDWNNDRDLSELQLKTYLEFIDEDESENKVISALAIVFNMLGMGLDKLQNKIDRFCNTAAMEPINKDIVFASMMKLNSKKTFASYKNSGCKEYEILGADDSRTCDLCKSMNGKIFKTSDARMGENMPPFHDGCRCTTVVHFPKDEIDEAFEQYTAR